MVKSSLFVVANLCFRTGAAKGVFTGFINPCYGLGCGSRTLITSGFSSCLRSSHNTHGHQDSFKASQQIRNYCSDTSRDERIADKTFEKLGDQKNKLQVDVEHNLKTMREGTYNKHVPNPETLQHFRSPKAEGFTEGTYREPEIGSNALPHPIWKEDDLHSVEITHMKPKGFVDNMAFSAVKLLRFGFDVLSGYNRRTRDEKVWLNRISFLETVAGVPGMVAAMVRHLHSLRRMRRDHGWIHTLLEEAENERMHLMTALQLKEPSLLFRWSVVATQGVFVGGFSIAYLLSPKFCHRFVGYLEEEAVVTYTKLLRDIESGHMQHWNTKAAPTMAITYWKLPSDATMKDVILAIRADEAHHRVVNHTLGSMKADDYNPYKPGE